MKVWFIASLLFIILSACAAEQKPQVPENQRQGVGSLVVITRDDGLVLHCTGVRTPIEGVVGMNFVSTSFIQLIDCEERPQ